MRLAEALPSGYRCGHCEQNVPQDEYPSHVRACLAQAMARVATRPRRDQSAPRRDRVRNEPKPREPLSVRSALGPTEVLAQPVRRHRSTVTFRTPLEARLETAAKRIEKDLGIE